MSVLSGLKTGAGQLRTNIPRKMDGERTAAMFHSRSKAGRRLSPIVEMRTVWIHHQRLHWIVNIWQPLRTVFTPFRVNDSPMAKPWHGLREE
jgi:hypothetical protein